ncbi:hypothetical protein KY309_01435 [Candidatus Woesearchaeota archaeon]|nr:hypothetical protein [Candidatus Woesearchaeota archaeon]MBW3016253.1 hypothetical protein [Candidatus Woesearchaeota archaeon]
MLPYTEFYSQLFKNYGVDPFTLKKTEDWHEKGLPLIKKITYMKNPKDFVVKPDKKTIAKNFMEYLDSQDEYGEAIHFLLTSKEQTLKEYYTPKMLVFSGGTESGNPTPVMLTTTQKLNTMMAILKITGEIINFDADKKIGMNLFPYAPHLGWHAVHHALDINADLNLCTAAGGAMPTERLVALADKTKPNIICGMSDYLRNRFLPMAIQKKITLPEKVLFVNGAQKMHEPERQKIAQLAKKLGVQQTIVLDLYAASELKEALMPECKPGSGFHHIAPLSTIIKTVKINKTEQEHITEWEFAENGYAASWNIDGAGTLLAGYLIGDRYDKVVNEKCQNCQLNVTRIYGVNRIKDVEAQLKLTGMIEEKVKGTRVNLSAIREAALSLPEVKEAQVVLKKNRIELYYVSDRKIKQKLEKMFAGAEIKPKIIQTTLEKITGIKLRA